MPDLVYRGGLVTCDCCAEQRWAAMFIKANGQWKPLCWVCSQTTIGLAKAAAAQYQRLQAVRS